MKEITMKDLENPQGIIDKLTYSNYAHNRNISPEIHPDRWEKIYPNAVAMENEYLKTFSPDHKLIDDMDWDGIDTRDWPDMVDAYISRCCYAGREMTEGEMECIDEGWKYEALIDHMQ